MDPYEAWWYLRMGHTAEQVNERIRRRNSAYDQGVQSLNVFRPTPEYILNALRIGYEGDDPRRAEEPQRED